MPSHHELKWTHEFIARPDILPEPSKGGANGQQGQVSDASQSLPQPMGHDCKVVRGKVPGPKNIVLCGAHGHILDTDKKQIIAHSLREYLKSHQGHGHHGGAHGHQESILTRNPEVLMDDDAPQPAVSGKPSPEQSKQRTAELAKRRKDLEHAAKELGDAFFGFESNPAVQAAAKLCPAEAAKIMQQLVPHRAIYAKAGTAAKLLEKFSFDQPKEVKHVIPGLESMKQAIPGLGDTFKNDPVLAALRGKAGQNGNPSEQKAVQDALTNYQKASEHILRAADMLLGESNDMVWWLQQTTQGG
jgi:hypothetical protein